MSLDRRVGEFGVSSAKSGERGGEGVRQIAEGGDEGRKNRERRGLPADFYRKVERWVSLWETKGRRGYSARIPGKKKFKGKACDNGGI